MENDYQSLAHSRWDCKYHVVFVPKRRRRQLYGEIRRQLGGKERNFAGEHFWARGYAVSTVGFELEANPRLHPQARRRGSGRRGQVLGFPAGIDKQ